MTVEFTEMEKWFPDVNWLFGDEDDQGYGFREFIYIGINMKNKKLALGTFSSGSCDGCGLKDYEKDSINYDEYSEFNTDMIGEIERVIPINDHPKQFVMQSIIDKIRNIAGYDFPISKSYDCEDMKDLK